MKKAYFIILWVGICMASATLAFGENQPIKIGYVDMQKALNFCQAGIEAKKTITQEVDKIQKAISAKQKELDQLKEDLDKRGSVMNDSVRTAKEWEYQTKSHELDRLKRDSDEDLQMRDQQFRDQNLKKLAPIVQKLGEDGKYTYILEMNQPAILYISNALDLTDAVIKLADQKETENKK